MKKLRRILSLLLVFTMALVLCSCGDGDNGGNSNVQGDSPENLNGGDSGEPKYGGVYVQQQSVSPSSLFYIHMQGSAKNFVSMCTEPLGRYNPETAMYDPFLAESWDSSPDDNTFTIHLRDGIKFHDGSELTGEVVAWNLQYMIENGQGSLIGNPVSVEATDELTVIVKYDAFSVDWGNRVGQVLISSKQAFDEHGLEYCQNHPVGTGPFVFQEYIPDNRLTYVKNENYWQEGLPYLDGWEIQIIPEWAPTMSAFVNGEIDSFVGGDQSTIETLKAMGYEDKNAGAPNSYTVFGVYPNSKIEDDPFYDVKVRQAVLLYGIDWDNVNILAFAGTAKKSLQHCVEGSLMYDPDMEKESYYDAELAKEMLAEAGYPDGFDTTIYATAPNKSAAIAMQDELLKINVNAEVQEITFSDTVRWDNTKPGLFLANGYSADDIVLAPISSWYCSDSTSYGNNIKFSAEYDALLEEALSAETWDERIECGKELAWKLHVEECLYRVFALSPNTTFISDRAHDTGFEYNSLTPELAWVD